MFKQLARQKGYRAAQWVSKNQGATLLAGFGVWAGLALHEARTLDAASKRNPGEQLFRPSEFYSEQPGEPTPDMDGNPPQLK